MSTQLPPPSQPDGPAHLDEVEAGGASRAVAACAVCRSRRIHYAFSLSGHRVVRCQGCGLMFLNPQPSDRTLASIYTDDYFCLSRTEADRAHVAELKQATAGRLLDQLGPDLAGLRLLEVGCGHGWLLEVAADRGLAVTGIEFSADACEQARERLAARGGEVHQGEIVTLAPLLGPRFDLVVCCDVLEHVRDPGAFLAAVRSVLAPGGQVLVVVPSVDSWSARLGGTRWVEFKLEHLWYFGPKTLRAMLFQAGFSEFRGVSATKVLSFDYVAAHFERFPVPGWSPLVAAVRRLLPRALRRFPVPVVPSGIGLLARVRGPERLTLSVIMPAYNEAATVAGAIDRVLAKRLDGMELELVIVESGSTDGTREIVEAYAGRPGVTVLLEERPRGKGHAVRAGLARATGDFILIQDADYEYDIEDYDALLEPLRDGREAFVLGARHGGGAWKMRQFEDQPVRAAILNFGHWFFTALLNTVYGVRLRDPFTMYKVFRRDCLSGLPLVCNRFDFDHELVIKLVKRGFVPIEIPVNYRSRSFADGKKVRMFADPITWLWAIIRFRFS